MVAKKKDDEQVSMIDSFREFKDTKNIDRTTLVSVLEESFRNVLAMSSSTPTRVTSRFTATVWLSLTARWLTKTRRSASPTHAR